MKVNKFKLLASLGALMITGSVLAGTPSYDKQPRATEPAPELCGPWFSGISGGAWWVQDYDVSIGSVFPSDLQVEFETGFGVNLTPIGYRLSETLSLHLEVGYHEADVDGFGLFGGGIPFAATGGQLRVAPATLNFTANFPVSESVSIYVGGGAGVAYRDLEIESGFAFPGATFRDSGWNAIAQAKAGVKFEVGQCNFINVGYRYQHVFGNPDDIRGHMAEVGYTFTW